MHHKCSSAPKQEPLPSSECGGSCLGAPASLIEKFPRPRFSSPPLQRPPPSCSFARRAQTLAWSVLPGSELLGVAGETGGREVLNLVRDAL